MGAFFTELPRVRELLKLDVDAAFRGDPAAQSHAEVILQLSRHPRDHHPPAGARALPAGRADASRA